MNNKIFITGGTGYIGSRLIPSLIKNNFEVNALVREGSEKDLPHGCNIIPGNALDKNSYEEKVNGCNTFIHLIGVRHPGPGKKEEFKKVDLVSIEQASFIRPWYVLGPGHYWPYLILPFYQIFEAIPVTRETTLRLGLVKLKQIINCLTYAAKNPPEGIRIYDVKDIKEF